MAFSDNSLSQDDTIKENIVYANLISQLRQTVNKIRLFDEKGAIDQFNGLSSDIRQLQEECIKENYFEAEDLKRNLENIADIKDITLLGDMLENIVIPIMERWIQSKGIFELAVDEKYRIESTSSGFLTIKDIVANRYLHSNNDPMDEARYLIRKQFDPEKKEYMVWGCGLGYHIYQLYIISNGSVPIRVYDLDPDMVKYAYKYGVLSWIPKELVDIHIVDDTQQYINDERENTGLLLLASYIDCIKDLRQSYPLATRFLQMCFQYMWGHEVKLNFNSNKRLGLPDISKLDRSKVKKEAVVVGGGPSVDDYIDTIREWKGEKTLIAVGTVWKRLLREGINPDYAIIFDPSDFVFEQVDGINDYSATLLIAMQSNWRVARYYKGPIYTICNRCPGSGIEQYAEENGLDIWFSGGSVSVLAVEFAIRCFVDRLYLIGLDLAYPGDVSHAMGTINRSKMDTSNLIPITSVTGGKVYTDISLDTFRMWIEFIISETVGIEYINMSKGGARIKGTLWYEDLV